MPEVFVKGLYPTQSSDYLGWGDDVINDNFPTPFGYPMLASDIIYFRNSNINNSLTGWCTNLVEADTVVQPLLPMFPPDGPSFTGSTRIGIRAKYQGLDIAIAGEIFGGGNFQMQLRIFSNMSAGNPVEEALVTPTTLYSLGYNSDGSYPQRVSINAAETKYIHAWWNFNNNRVVAVLVNISNPAIPVMLDKRETLVQYDPYDVSAQIEWVGDTDFVVMRRNGSTLQPFVVYNTAGNTFNEVAVFPAIGTYFNVPTPSFLINGRFFIAFPRDDLGSPQIDVYEVNTSTGAISFAYEVFASVGGVPAGLTYVDDTLGTLQSRADDTLVVSSYPELFVFQMGEAGATFLYNTAGEAEAAVLELAGDGNYDYEFSDIVILSATELLIPYETWGGTKDAIGFIVLTYDEPPVTSGFWERLDSDSVQGFS